MKLFNQIYQDLICETNYVLPIPQTLFSYLKTKILNMETMNISISFSELFEHNCFSDWTEYNKKYLDIIKPNLLGNINIELIDINMRGMFIPSAEFGRLNFSSTELNNKSVSILNSDSPYIKAIKQHLNNRYKDLEEDKRLLQEINKHLSTIKIFGTFVFSKQILNQNTSLHRFTFDEILEHECQHFCNLLIAIAKTNQYYSRHFDKLFNPDDKYNLDEDEFITLLGSYTNYLVRVYFNHKKTDLNTFVHCLLDYVFSPNKQTQYLDIFKRLPLMEEVKTFYLDIWKSEQFQNVGKRYSKDKFNTLLKWTYKNLKENIQDD
jgi:hypothetical protein